MFSHSQRFVILDRDGVINYDSDSYIKSPEEWEPIPGSLQAIAQLNEAGFRVVVVTNQSGVARGYYDFVMLDLIHQKLKDSLGLVGGLIEEIFICPHHPEDDCVCRKPKPGLLYKVRDKFGINLEETFFIGDSIVDIQAAKQAGCIPLLVLTGNGYQTLELYPEISPIEVFSDLARAVGYVLQQRNANNE